MIKVPDEILKPLAESFSFDINSMKKLAAAVRIPTESHTATEGAS